MKSDDVQYSTVKCQELRGVSTGTAIVTEDKAALWTDGRYYLQAQREMDSNWTLMKDGLPGTLSQADWLNKMLRPSSRVGIDSELISAVNATVLPLTREHVTQWRQQMSSFASGSVAWKSLRESLSGDGHELVGVQYNLVDQVWTDQPKRPSNPLLNLSLEYTGKTWQEKVAAVRDKMKSKNASALVISALDDTAWLFNLRGSDVEFNPVFFAYTIITLNKTLMFLSEDYLTDEIRHHLSSKPSSNDLEFRPYADVLPVLKSIAAEQSGRVWISDRSNSALYYALPENRIVNQPSPVAVLKAVKNEQELAGMRNAHIKDAIALCEYFSWLEREVGKGSVSEISGADFLDHLRSEQCDYMGPSFATISSSGPNGAVIHYRPTPETDRQISERELYLCDSGAQFRDGTTDVTRTMHLGIPTEHEKKCFTLVLKGHISLARAVFPNGVKGSRLECLARQHLWSSGLDYLHGTGHGVGSFLNVHEGPCGIMPRPRPDEVALEAGMVLSNEPGYYEDGNFGIRIESLFKVVKTEPVHNFQNVGFLTFEPLTLVPIQSKMICTNLLSTDEITWLNNYHKICRDVIGSALQLQGREECFQWLKKETEPLTV